MRNLHLTFDWHYIGQKKGEDFAKFLDLLRIYELQFNFSGDDSANDSEDTEEGYDSEEQDPAIEESIQNIIGAKYLFVFLLSFPQNERKIY